ncbi:golgin candidate 4-like [Actinidia eriantha]|uniref:golgin candidate 4-like n=1 Tax=Actinidia eriantha TaxID=165200 RepID=UPI002590310A|nr:golgin candidate 4-like [Actinidia eriantha]
MMWSSIANLKENLHKIALDVHDDDDETLEIYNSPDRNGASDRRISHNFARSSPASHSTLANGFDSPYNSEIEQYKAEIKRLQESESEIKALSLNYAALLKEKEDWIFRLNEENGLLKQNLEVTNAARNESFKTSVNTLNGLKGGGDQSPNRQHKASVKSRSVGNRTNNGFISKQDGLSNGIAQSVQPDVSQTTMEKRSDIQGNEKDLADLLEAKNRSLAAIQEAHERQIKNLELELERERGKLSNIQLQLQEEQKLNGSFQKELNLLKVDKDKATAEMNKMRDELNQKISEVRQLQMEVNRGENAVADDIAEGLKRVVASLEKETNDLKMEKVELESALKAASNSSAHKVRHDTRENSMKENVQSLGSFPGKEEMELSIQKLEKDLKETRQQRDKASQELNRLKKHLLDKESEESEKMDEDNKIIEELRERNEYQRLQIQQLQKALKQSIASQDEVKMANNSELQKYKEIVEDLNRKLSSYGSMIDAKNVELLNLQTALGQYYAEIEAKEHLEGDLARAREESTKLADLLKDAHQQGEITRKEKEDILEKLSQADRTLAEGRNRVNKLEEDNAKLRRALEQNMSRINRMSVDSDFLVDRRIVIKLLVTYFQRNHSKEVLDLMVRMLGFSDEDKQRIGGAQQGTGKGVVRGVLGLPGRLVGGILGGGSAEANANTASENQSFADLWVDFLLKETERRESAEAINASNGDQQNTSPNDTAAASPIPSQRTNSAGSPASRLSPSPYQYNSPLLLRGNILQPEHLDSEFSTVPLTSSERITSQVLRPLPRY